MKTPLIIAVCLALTACHQLQTPTEQPQDSNNEITSANNEIKSVCKKMPPVVDKTKLIAMLIDSGEINTADTDSEKLQKLERYILNKRKGMAKKCK